MGSSSFSEPGDNMEAVRDLLFGKKAKEIDARIADLDRSSHTAVDSLERRLMERLSAVESFFRSEVHALTEKINGNADQARQDKESLSTRVSNLNHHVDEEISRLHDFTKANREEDKAENRRRFAELEQKLLQAVSDLTDLTHAEVAKLRHTATDRQSLGDFLIDLGNRLQSNSDEKVEEQVARSAEKAVDEALELVG